MYFTSPKIYLAETVEWIRMLKEDTENFKFPEDLREKTPTDRQDKTFYMLSLKERTERVLLSVNARQPTRERH